MDAATLDTDEKVAEAVRTCTVFGRVTPAQKRKFVKALQADGHTVAMTGDGVNDVLALKDADCGIAMASGAQAASQVAQLVLLESDFSGLPAVVAEGRRVINNIQRSASLFLVKNIFSFLLTFISLFITMPYPLQPLQLSLLSMVTIGIPSFILALEPNHEMVHGKFIQNVLRAALPGGLSDLLLILGIEAFVFAFELPIGTLTTLTTLLLLAVGMAVLWDVCKPFTVAHGVLWGGMLILAGAAIALLGGFLGLEHLDMRGMLILIVFLLLVVQTLHSMERRPGRRWRCRCACVEASARERAKRKKTTEFPRRSTINKNGMYCSRTRVQYMPFLVIREAAVKGGQLKKLYFQNFCQFPQIRIIPNHCIHTQRFQLGGLFHGSKAVHLFGSRALGGFNAGTGISKITQVSGATPRRWAAFRYRSGAGLPGRVPSL